MTAPISAPRIWSRLIARGAHPDKVSRKGDVYTVRWYRMHGHPERHTAREVILKAFPEALMVDAPPETGFFRVDFKIPSTPENS